MVWVIRRSSWNAKKPDTYHTDSDCQQLTRVEEERIERVTKDEAAQRGLRVCKVCNGTKTNTTQCPLCGADIPDFRKHVDLCPQVNM